MALLGMLSRSLIFLFFASSYLLGASLEDFKYVRYLESVSYKLIDKKTIVVIELSDRSLWRWIPDLYTENFLQTWEKGDLITIRANQSPGLLLYNPSHPHFLPIVTLPHSSYLFFPQLEAVSAEGDYLMLSDHSCWELVYDFAKKSSIEWIPKDRIIPVQITEEEFVLINLNIPHKTRKEIDRSLQVKKVSLPMEDLTSETMCGDGN